MFDVLMSTILCDVMSRDFKKILFILRIVLIRLFILMRTISVPLIANAMNSTAF